MTASAPPRPVDDPQAVLEVLAADPEVHPYGLADVEQLWSRSRWRRDGPAVVGVLDLPGADRPMVYAVSASADQRTIDLTTAVCAGLDGEADLHAPRGAAAALRASGVDVVRCTTHRKLARPAELAPPEPDQRVRLLDAGDVAGLRDLYGTDPAAGGYFHAGLLDAGPHVGIDDLDAGRLAAAAGVHVLSERWGVAAIANVATRPSHRGRGLARAVVGSLVGVLRRRVPVVGLNVADDNAAARRVYTRLGFVPVVAYEELRIRSR